MDEGESSGFIGKIHLAGGLDRITCGVINSVGRFMGSHRIASGVTSRVTTSATRLVGWITDGTTSRVIISLGRFGDGGIAGVFRGGITSSIIGRTRLPETMGRITGGFIRRISICRLIDGITGRLIRRIAGGFTSRVCHAGMIDWVGGGISRGVRLSGTVGAVGGGISSRIGGISSRIGGIIGDLSNAGARYSDHGSGISRRRYSERT